MTAQGLDPRLGAEAVLLAAAVGSGVKAAIGTFVGGLRFGLLFAAGTLLAALAAAAAYGLA
jgi:hypothetical protein